MTAQEEETIEREAAVDEKKGGCRVKKRTIAIALFGVGIVGAVIVWGIIR